MNNGMDRELLVTQISTSEVRTRKAENGTLSIIEKLYAQVYVYVHWGCKMYVHIF
jgi:hypothetical protein